MLIENSPFPTTYRESRWRRPFGTVFAFLLLMNSSNEDIVDMKAQGHFLLFSFLVMPLGLALSVALAVFGLMNAVAVAGGAWFGPIGWPRLRRNQNLHQ